MAARWHLRSLVSVSVTLALFAAIFVVAGVSRTVKAEATQEGERLYQRCAACHLPNGAGVPGAFPPLGPQLSIFAESAAGRTYLVLVVARGLAGALTVDGMTYNGVMPPQAPPMSESEIAAVLNFVIRTFAVSPGRSEPPPFDRTEVAEILDQNSAIRSPHQVRPFREPAGADRRLAPNTAKGVANAARARMNWQLHCQGCHGAEASGSANGAPAMSGQVARFLAVNGGRAFLGRVPGVANAPLASDLLAELLNWMLYRFDPSHIPANFEPYSAAEIEALRDDVLIEETAARRAQLLAQLSQLQDEK